MQKEPSVSDQVKGIAYLADLGIWTLGLTSGDFGLLQLEAELWFPGQRLKSVCSSESAKSWLLDHQ